MWLPTLLALKLFGRKAAAALRRGDALVRPTYIKHLGSLMNELLAYLGLKTASSCLWASVLHSASSYFIKNRRRRALEELTEQIGTRSTNFLRHKGSSLCRVRLAHPLHSRG